MTAKEQTLIDIFEEDKKMFYAYAETLTIGNIDVDDILNKAFYEALKYAENVTHPRAFLFKEIRYAAYALYLKRKRREQLDVFFHIERKFVSPIYYVNRTDDFSEETIQAFHYLSELEKTIINHKIFNDLYFYEIASLIGYSTSRTIAMYYDALEIIREELEAG